MGRLERLIERRMDSSVLVKASMVNEVYKRMDKSESVRYAIGAMQPIDPEYTKNTVLQGEKVKSQLEERLTQKCEIEPQGSTSTDTHIQARSDVDLLLVRKGWVWVEDTQVVTNPYSGNAWDDMRRLRSDAKLALGKAFPAAEVDDSRPCAIKITGGSLARDVDVVPATWFDTDEYKRTGDKLFRGVKILNKETDEFVANLPFLHKRRIEERDQETRGGLRKAIRLLKTLMYDSEGRVKMSSYNICGIAFNIPKSDLTVQKPRELAILEACHTYCNALVSDNCTRDSIRTPNGHRTVFGGSEGTTLSQLIALNVEMSNLRLDILRDNARAIRSLVEENVDYPVAFPA